MQLPRKAFEDLVSQAVAGLPEEFLEKLEDVLIMVEDNPRPEHLAGRKLPPGTLLLGLYQGVPLTHRSPFSPYQMPDRITIFQQPIESICRTKEEIVAQVRRTVLHEIAHYFGISDPRLRELGY
jgi:predicted Zn-dependent protease with MMP-like domain